MIWKLPSARWMVPSLLASTPGPATGVALVSSGAQAFAYRSVQVDVVAAATLGFEFVTADPDAGTIEVAFSATESFTNPMGEVLGAFLAAMVFDTIGPALLATLGPDEFQNTLELKTSFLRPAFPGRLVGRGRVVHRVGDLAFLEASLADDAGVLATGSATARVTTRGSHAKP